MTQISTAFVALILQKDWKPEAQTDTAPGTDIVPSKSDGGQSAPDGERGDLFDTSAGDDERDDSTMSRFMRLTPGLNLITAPMRAAGRRAAQRGGASEQTIRRVEGIGEGVSSRMLDLFSRSPAGRFGENVLEQLNGVSDAAKEAGSKLGPGWAEGFRSQLSSIENKARMSVDKLIADMQQEGEIASPSRRARRLLGFGLVAGIGLGIRRNRPLVQGAIHRNIDNALFFGLRRRRVKPRHLLPAYALMQGLRAKAGIGNMGIPLGIPLAASSTMPRQTMPRGGVAGRLSAPPRVAPVPIKTPTRQPVQQQAQQSSGEGRITNNFNRIGGNNVSGQVAMSIQRSLRRLGVA